MKKIKLLSILFLLASCAGDDQLSIDRERGYKIVKIDSCQYIMGTSGYPYMIHKANCPNH